MRIGIAYYGPYPQNRGIDQLAQALGRIGHEPEILARKPDDAARVNEYRKIPLIQVPRSGDDPFTSAPFPVNPYWINLIEEEARERQWEALFARETVLAYPALRAARRLGIPAYLDMRENLGAMYAHGPSRSLTDRLIRNRLLISSYESLTVPHFDGVFAVSEELKNWVVAAYKIDDRDVSVLGNYPSAQFLEEARQARKQVDKNHSDAVQIVHAGYVHESKGLQDIVRALAVLKKRKVRSLMFRVIGGGNNAGSYVESLKDLVANLGLEQVVKFEPYPESKKLAKKLAVCDVGVCSYLLNEFTHQTLPGKLFEYMALGLPILSSARRPVVRVLKGIGCGVVYHTRDPEEIADALQPLVEDPDLRREKGSLGIRAVRESYNEDTNVEVLRREIGRPTIYA